MPIRKPDWPARLELFLSLRSQKPFGYGANDCCLFVADAVLAMTDTDLAAPFRGRYHSRREALSLVKAYSGRASLRAFFCLSLAELTEVSPLQAQRGDILLVGRGRDASLGVLALNGLHILAVSACGFLRLDLSRAERAWRI